MVLLCESYIWKKYESKRAAIKSTYLYLPILRLVHYSPFMPSSPKRHGICIGDTDMISRQQQPSPSQHHELDQELHQIESVMGVIIWISYQMKGHPQVNVGRDCSWRYSLARNNDNLQSPFYVSDHHPCRP